MHRQKSGFTNEKFIFHGERGLVLRELIPQRADKRSARLVGLEKERIPKRQEGVARTDSIPHHKHGLLVEHPRFPATSVDMSVGAKERLKCRGLKVETAVRPDI